MGSVGLDLDSCWSIKVQVYEESTYIQLIIYIILTYSWSIILCLLYYFLLKQDINAVSLAQVAKLAPTLYDLMVR